MLPPIDLVIMQAAGSAQAHPKPSWTEPLLIAGMAVIGVGFVATDRVEDRRAQRRIYWAAWTLAGVLFAVALAFRGWAVMVAAFALAVFAALVYAYFLTGYLKIGRRIVAFSNRNTRPDPPRDGSTAQPPRIRDRDAYPGDIPASRVWWVIALLMAGLAVGVVLGGWTAWQPFAFAAFLVVLGAICGIDDATRRLPVVRGQYVQGFIAMVCSIPAFGLPALAYGLGYLIGRRRPMGRGRHDAAARHYCDLDGRRRDSEATNRDDR
ncbi:hypothetical protein [Mycobacterium branderi]|uniref:Uncharacterized protein n=1 Tax=Mycobacterium branderi TaxID=43348 RepID=A0A7I7WBS9_9MYCO|nr:hypothetical protein [Mycobacterium branderi]MCV7235275.1 hypothetical protein [Mycobacterium branderi]ORA29872.1 hypothetical protein BST20_27875 [Mycobacterium branderi]BBZ15049.1 hypothetical protein MBRA_52440 [Mycobacterium branderi]